MCGGAAVGCDCARARREPAPGFTETSYAGLTSPTAMALAPDGRIFVCEQAGKLRVIKNGALLPTPFVTLTVDSARRARAARRRRSTPTSPTNQYVYVYYTVPRRPAHNRLSRFTANGDVAVPGSEIGPSRAGQPVERDEPQRRRAALRRGREALHRRRATTPTARNSQTLTNLLGKMLRLNSDGTIPTDNPFYGTADGQEPSIWALRPAQPVHVRRSSRARAGSSSTTWARTPGRRSTTGWPGANYGWPTARARSCRSSDSVQPAVHEPLLLVPARQRRRARSRAATSTTRRSRSSRPSYVGKYFFADYCAGWIKYIDPTATGNPPAVTTSRPGSLARWTSTSATTATSTTSRAAPGTGRTR